LSGICVRLDGPASIELRSSWAGEERYDFFGGGTFFPARRASERPMAMACLGFVTFLPLRPDLSCPFFIARISVSTLLPAAEEYLRDDFFAVLFLAPVDLLLFFAGAPLRAAVLLRAMLLFVLALLRVLLFFAEDRLEAPLFFAELVLRAVLFFVALDLFVAVFFAAIFNLLWKSDVEPVHDSCLSYADQMFFGLVPE
jgi:hypothetical protein